MSTEAEGGGGGLIGELVEELGGRPWWRHRWRSHGCGGEATIRWATTTAEQHRAHGQTAKHSTTSGDDAGGCRHAIQPARRRSYHRRHREGGQKPQRGQAEANRASRADRLGDARRRWRRAAAKSTNPRGQMEALDEAEQMPHMAMAEPAGARRNRAARSSAIRNRQRGEEIRVSASDRVGERERGGSRLGRAGPVKPTRVDLTSGPRLSAASFCFN
jgi:hypothetical protein